MKKITLYLLLLTFANHSASSQNVGIGTSSPAELLHIKSAAGAGRNLIEQTSPTGWAEFQAKSDSVDLRLGAAGSQTTLSFNGTVVGAHAFFTTMGNQPVHIGTNAYVRLTASQNGNIGIGTMTPTEKLSVIGNITATGSINSTSDIRFKTAFVPLTSALPGVMNLHPFYYHWRSGYEGFTNNQQLGFSAQEVEKYFPVVVTTDSKGFKAIDYGRLTSVLVRAIQEQQAQLTSQQSEIDQLKTQVEKLLAWKDTIK